MESPEVMTDALVQLKDHLGVELVRWLARVAFVAWAGWLILTVARAPAVVRRFLWSTGLLVHMCHVGCAFHFIHHWSHAEAVEHTARLTARVTGWHWGQGVWINYAFTLLWIIDAAWWWTQPANRPRPPVWTVPLHAFFLFLFFNATVVFGPWGWKPVGVGVVLLVGVTWKVAGHASTNREKRASDSEAIRSGPNNS